MLGQNSNQNDFDNEDQNPFSRDNPHYKRNIAIAISVIILAFAVLCFVGYGVISDRAPAEETANLPQVEEAEVSEDQLPVGVLPVTGADLRASADTNSEILGKAQMNPLEVLGKDLKNPDESNDDWIFVRDGNDLEGWIPVAAVIVNKVELDLSKVPDKDGSQPSPVVNDSTAEPEQESGGCPARVTIEPPANAFVNEEDGKVYSFSYKLEEDRPYVVTVPCGSVSTMAFGNATINGQKFTASEIEGNVVYTTCDEPLGCSYQVEDFTAGHFIVTIVYPGMEEPQQSVFNAVSNMFDPSNCGGSGCPIAYLTDADHLDQTVKFDKKPAIGEISINDFTVEPTIGSVIGEPTTKTIKVGGVEVGQVYSLESKELQYIGVPEQHDGFTTGLYIECPNGCVVYGATLKSGESAVVYANPGDENTPSDLNWTVAVQSDNPEMVTVWFIYADDVDSYSANPTYKFNSQGLIQ